MDDSASRQSYEAILPSFDVSSINSARYVIMRRMFTVFVLSLAI